MRKTSPASPSPAFSSAGLRRLHETLAGHITRGPAPGLVALVARGDEVHVEALGTLTIGGTEPVRRDTIFRIASMTKPIAAVATLMLVEEGRLSLDEPVDRLLPELANRRVIRRLDAPLDDTVPARRPITVRDVLTFRLGHGFVMAAPESSPLLRETMRLGVAPGMPAPAGMPAPEEWIRRLGMLPLVHQPGEQWLYHTGSDVLTALVARAAGQPFDRFLQERLFAPLGMKDTAFHVPADKLGRFATSYWTNFETGKFEVYDPAEGGQWSRPPAFPAGGSGLVSTVDDYLAFSRLLLNRGRHGRQRLLTEASVAAMTTDQLTPAQKAASAELSPGFWKNHGWGLGLSVVTQAGVPAEPPGLFGWDGGLGTSAWSDPARQLTGIILTQNAYSSPTAPEVIRDFWEAVYAAVSG